MTTTPTINLDTTVQAISDQVSSELADETVILKLTDGVYYGLDAVGAHIWQLIQEETTVKAVRDQLLQEYEVSAERCERDLLDLLQELREHGLIQVSR